MSIIDKIEKVKREFKIETEENKFLKAAGKDYDEMVEKGLFQPRGNQIEQTYRVITYKSNLSK